MQFDLVAALVISVAVFIDFAIRGLAFRRIDSFGLSIATFSTVYSAVELARAEGDQSAFNNALLRFAIAGVCALVLTLYHVWCRETLWSQLDDLFEQLRENLPDDAHPDDRELAVALLNAFGPMAKNSIPVTFVFRNTEDLRPTKKTWREQTTTLINRILYLTHERPGVSEKQLLLPAWMRRTGWISFLLIGMLSVLAQVITV